MKDRDMDTDDYYAQVRIGTQDAPQREYDPDEACDRDYIEEDIEEAHIPSWAERHKSELFCEEDIESEGDANA